MAYIDDILVIAETVELARDHTSGVIYLLENLGFIIHPEKTAKEPSQEVEFLGMMVDSREMELRLPGQKIKKLRQEAGKIRDQLTPPTAREVSHLLGKFNAVSQAVPPGEGSGKSPRVEQAVLRLPMLPLSSCQGGVGVVEQPANELEWEESGFKTTRPSDRVRCLPDRLGSIVPWLTDGRSVVQAGENSPHKLSGATISNTGSKNIPEESEEQESPATAGQSNSSSLHKQSGWDSVRPCCIISKRTLDVVPSERHFTDSAVLAREGECQGRHRVEGDEGPL